MNYITTVAATAAEIAAYEAVELATENYTLDELCDLIEKVGDFACSFGAERKAAYNKLRSVARKLDVSILDLETWYFIDAAM